MEENPNFNYYVYLKYDNIDQIHDRMEDFTKHSGFVADQRLINAFKFGVDHKTRCVFFTRAANIRKNPLINYAEYQFSDTLLVSPIIKNQDTSKYKNSISITIEYDQGWYKLIIGYNRDLVRLNYYDVFLTLHAYYTSDECTGNFYDVTESAIINATPFK